MATLEHLVSIGKLKKHDPDLEHTEFPERHVYLAPGADAWFVSMLGNAMRIRGRNLTPVEQVEQFLYDFVRGVPINHFQRKKLDPFGLHVWELKTADVRLFGWFARKKHFVVACGEMKMNLLAANLYKPHIAAVVSFRGCLDLDDPKTLTGESYVDHF